MKTLIVNGSPKKVGNTIFLLDKLKSKLNSEIKVIISYYDGIKPCIDCRFCFTHEHCVFGDYMTKVFQDIIKSDNIIIATPVYFSQPTGFLINIMSRLQMF